MIQFETSQKRETSSAWIEAYREVCLSTKDPSTKDTYQHALRDFLFWLYDQAMGKFPFRRYLLGVIRWQ